jgi:fructose/tagatose bisphosphate aldolase
MPTDHDRIVTVEGTVGTLCKDVDTLKTETEELKSFKQKVEAMAALSKFQLALTFGNGCLISLVLYLHH